MIQYIKLKYLGHSRVNLNLRKKDLENKDGALTDAAKRQQSSLYASILNNKAAKDVKPRIVIDGVEGIEVNNPEVNWLTTSILEVEPRPSEGKDTIGDTHGKPYSTLSGSNRLTVLERILTENPEFGEFELPCEVHTPTTDAERRRIIVKGNSDAPEAATKIPQNYPSRFTAFYEIAPKPDYLFERDDAKTPTAKDRTTGYKEIQHTESGWTSTDYQRKTGIGNSNHVPYSALTRLGRHFDLPLEVFTPERLRIKPEVTAALLVRSMEAGEGKSKTVKDYGLGIEPRYIIDREEAGKRQTRAESAKRAGETFEEKDLTALDDVKALYKAEFLYLIDCQETEKGYTGDGKNALGNVEKVTLSADEKAAKETATKEDAKKADYARLRTVISERLKYDFERETAERLHALPEAKKALPEMQNALQLVALLTLDESTAQELAEWRKAPSNTDAHANALMALATACITLIPDRVIASAKHIGETMQARDSLGEQVDELTKERDALKVALHEANAAHAQHNTKKAKR